MEGTSAAESGRRVGAEREGPGCGVSGGKVVEGCVALHSPGLGPIKS